MFASNIGTQRQARIGVSSFFFITGLCFATWASRIPDVQHHIGLSKAALGSVLFASPVGSMLCLPLAGFLVTRFGSRTCLFVGTFLYAFALCIIGLTNTPWQLVAALFFYGMSANLMNISVNTQAVDVEVLYGRSIMASFHGLWSLAGATGAGIGWLMVWLGVRPEIHFIIVACIMVLSLTIFFRFTLQHIEHVQHKEKFSFKWNNVKAILTLGIIAFCCMGCEGCMFDWSGIYFRDVVNAPAQYVTVGYTVFMCTMACGRFIADAMVVRYGTIKVLQASGCLISAGLLTAVLFPSFFSAAFGFFLTGFGVSSVVPLTYGVAGKTNKMKTGIAISLVSSVGFLGFLFGPPLIGYIAEMWNLRWSFGLMAIIGFGTFLFARKVKME